MSQEKQRTTRCIDVKGLMKKKMHRLGGVANMLENSILDPNIGKRIAKTQSELLPWQLAM